MTYDWQTKKKKKDKKKIGRKDNKINEEKTNSPTNFAK